MQSALTVVAVIIVIYIIYRYVTREDFSTRQEKATALSEWFSNTTSPTYTAYKKAITGSDIVEYERVRSAVANGASMDAIARMI